MVRLPSFLRKLRSFDRRRGKERRQEQLGTKLRGDRFGGGRIRVARSNYWEKMEPPRPKVVKEPKDSQRSNSLMEVQDRRQSIRRKEDREE